MNTKYWGEKQNGVDVVSADDFNNAFGAIADDMESLENEQIILDIEMSDTSNNAVQNKVVKAYIDESIQSAILDSWEVAV